MKSFKRVRKYIGLLLALMIFAVTFSHAPVKADDKYRDTSGGKWVQEEENWKYQLKNGEYLKEEWVQIDKIWYYFYEDKTMACDCYIGGYWMDYNGAWTYPNIASWRSDGKWWYGDDTGWYAKNAWYKIDGKFYHFDSSGYLETNKFIDGYYVN
ncbi:MAG: hypothetical protein K6E10_00750, partial [Eubacterium sp.]|nr:hypothetical protein [Eubacterium sp.]